MVCLGARVRSVERGICHIAAQTATLHPRASVSECMGVYYAEKVAQYANKYECPIGPSKGVRISCNSWLLQLLRAVACSRLFTSNGAIW